MRQTTKMKHFVIFIFSIFLLSGCNSDTRLSILNKCMTLGGESIIYARANYVKLFYHFNSQKFDEPFKQIKDFDYVTHRNVINNYNSAVKKLPIKDSTTKSLISACIKLAKFSKNLVDQSYPRAISHKSDHNPLTDKFFSEINGIVKFDHNIGDFDSSALSFKQHVDAYKKAVLNYQKIFKVDLISE